MGVWTDEYFGLVQGLCIALLTFIIVNSWTGTTPSTPSC
jgi:hypothetical protein